MTQAQEIATDAQASLRVSVIIPAYNAADYISTAIHSALMQTEKSLEIIVVDDASKDNTWAVVTALAKRYPQIRPFRLDENAAAPHALNYATDRARGKWVALLDSDDWYAPDRLKLLIDLAEEKNFEIVADNLSLIDIQAKAYVGPIMPQRGRVFTIGLDEYLEKSNPTSLFDYGILKPVINADFMRRHNIRYYEPAKTGYDFYFLLSCFATGARAVITDEAFYYYVQPQGFISNAPSHGRRSRYKYEIVQMANRHFTDLLRAGLSAKNLAYMNKRGNRLQVILCFHLIKEAIEKKCFKEALVSACEAPPAFWPFIVGRVVSRLNREIKNSWVRIRKLGKPENYYIPQMTDG